MIDFSWAISPCFGNGYLLAVFHMSFSLGTQVHAPPPPRPVSLPPLVIHQACRIRAPILVTSLNYSLKALSPNTVTFRFRVSTYEFWGGYSSVHNTGLKIDRDAKLLSYQITYQLCYSKENRNCERVVQGIDKADVGRSDKQNGNIEVTQR